MTAHDNDDRTELLKQAIRLKKTSARSRTRALPRRPDTEPARLGEMQESLWLAHEVDPSSPAYNVTNAFRIHGELDAAKLERALNDVVGAHRLLRSTFRRDRDGIRQTIHARNPIRVDVVDTVDDPLDRLRQSAREPFDLEAGPLIRVCIVDHGPTRERFLLLVLHHILADERSLGLLWDALAAAYEARPTGPGEAVQYDDFVHWARHREPSSRDRADEFWRRRLTPAPDPLRLPFEKPTRTETDDGTLIVRPLSLTVRQNIRRVASETGSTPFVVFALAFRLLLARYTGARRPSFLTPVSTRTHPATATMMGYFLNPIAMVCELDEDQRVEHAIRALDREVNACLQHAATPLHTIAVDRRVMFVHQETREAPTLGSVRLEPLTLDLGAAKFDLTLFVTESARSLALAVEYRTRRYDRIWMERLLGHYETLLETLPDDLERSLSAISMLDAREELQLRSASQGPTSGRHSLELLPRQILDRTRETPNAPAVVCGGARQSFAELSAAASRISRELRAHGVGVGDRVGVYVERSTHVVAALIGAHCQGAAYVPLDPSYPSARNRDVLEDADVSVVLTTSTARGRLPDGRWTTIEIDGPPRSGNAHATSIPAESPAYILYTSGSTGRPKGVVVTHENLRASTTARRDYYDTVPKRFLLVPSVSFDSSVAGLFWTLSAGGTLVVPTDEEARDAERLAELVRDADVTDTLLTPSLYGQMLAAGAEQLSALENVIVAGEPCPSGLVAKHFQSIPHARLFNEYGPTEATVWATVHEMLPQDARRPVPIGRPIPGVRVDVVDGRGRLVPAGVSGAAWIAGPTVAQGYWRRPELTAERFDAERGYRTGDRMAWTPDGRLLFLGREDEQIKLRGFRIEPGEIEAALLDSSDVEEAAVVSDSHQLVAFVRGARVERKDLAHRLPDYMIPNRFVTVDELPRLPNGKVDRGKLREIELEPETASHQRAIVSTQEQTLLSLWEGLLDRSGFSVHDNFFELGGHSLLVVEMTRAIERDFEVSLRAADVFEHPTVRELSQRIRATAVSAPYEHLFPIQTTGRRDPFVIAVPHFFTQMLAKRFRGERPVYGLRGVSLRADGNRGRWPTMADLGEELAEEIRRRFPGRAVILAGYSFGATMAVEAARLLEADGVTVHRLYLIAPMAEDFYRLGPARVQLHGLRKPVSELSRMEALRSFLRSNDPRTRRPYQNAWRRLAIEPWRRLLCAVGDLRATFGLPRTVRILHADIRVERFRLHAGYRPGHVRAPTVIFNAREPATDAAATWRPHFGGPFDVIDTPDPHLDDASAEAARSIVLEHLNEMDDA